MTAKPFSALVLNRAGDGSVSCSFQELAREDLPDGDVVVRVTHSSINYKDALAVTGKGKIARRFPMVAGIDLAGVVVESSSPQWKEGDSILSNGWGLGEETFGGFTEYARLDGTRLIRVPGGFDREQVMAIGTGGYTAMLAVLALEDRGIQVGDGPVLVTGAGGGVGGFSVHLLAQAGYTVTAVTGRESLRPYLTQLGATAIQDRSEFDREARPLESDVWAGAIDSVGGRTLATTLAQVRRGGAVASCGNAGGFRLETTVFPFILRGLALLGIDSNFCPMERRLRAWDRLARDLDPAVLREMYETAEFAEIPAVAERLIEGQVRGRVVVRMPTTD